MGGIYGNKGIRKFGKKEFGLDWKFKTKKEAEEKKKKLKNRGFFVRIVKNKDNYATYIQYEEGHYITKNPPRHISKKRAKEIEMNRPRRSRLRDEDFTTKRKGSIVKDERWAKNPGKYDYPGVDTAAVGRKRKRKDEKRKIMDQLDRYRNWEVKHRFRRENALKKKHMKRAEKEEKLRDKYEKKIDETKKKLKIKKPSEHVRKLLEEERRLIRLSHANDEYVHNLDHSIGQPDLAKINKWGNWVGKMDIKIRKINDQLPKEYKRYNYWPLRPYNKEDKYWKR